VKLKYPFKISIPNIVYNYDLDLYFFLQLVKKSATERTKSPSASLMLQCRRSRNGNYFDFIFLKKYHCIL